VLVVVLAIAAIVIGAVLMSGGPDEERSNVEPAAEKPAKPATAKQQAAKAQPAAPATPATSSRAAPVDSEEPAAQTQEKEEPEAKGEQENEEKGAKGSEKKGDDEAEEESASSGSVPVKVKVEPTTAIIFRGSRRLGTGEVTVKVKKGETVKLVVLHRGYNYRRIKLDGSKTDVTVRLIKIPDETEDE
jgi:hypothetical protein